MQQHRYDKIQLLFPDLMIKDKPLAPMIAFKVGGPADLFCQPQDIKILKSIVKAAFKNKIKLFVIGGGTNLIVQDGGIRGLVLKLGQGFKEIYTDGERLYAGCAAKLPRVCLHAAKKGLKGLECLAGIPGTVGGAIAMNAGTTKGESCKELEKLIVCEKNGEIRSFGPEDFTFSYRSFKWKDKTPLEDRILLKAVWKLKAACPLKLKKEIFASLSHRKNRQPINKASAGCIFKNPEDMAAGRIIDEAGFKGTRKGGAIISSRHANFIINRGNAQASDILSLANLVQDQILERYGILLEKEVRIVGEEQTGQASFC